MLLLSQEKNKNKTNLVIIAIVVIGVILLLLKETKKPGHYYKWSLKEEERPPRPCSPSRCRLSKDGGLEKQLCQYHQYQSTTQKNILASTCCDTYCVVLLMTCNCQKIP